MGERTPGLTHRVWTRTESWYSRSYMQIFRSTLGLGTHTGTSMATPTARKYSCTQRCEFNDTHFRRRRVSTQNWVGQALRVSPAGVSG